MRIARASLALLGALAGVPLAALALALRPAWREGLWERLGGGPVGTPGAVWVHAASIGETLAARPVVAGLAARGFEVVTSSATVTGRRMQRALRPDATCRLAPLDHPWCVDAALRRARPAALVLVEGELWPVWITSAASRGIPVVVVSGRLSPRATARHRSFRWLFGSAWRRIAAVGARTAADADRFRALGIEPERVTVTGDLKLDAAGPAHPVATDLARILGDTPLVVAGSTHEGEEAAALTAFRDVSERGLEAALVLAPRRPERAGSVERSVRDAGLPLRRRARPGSAPLRPGEVLVLDTVGELAALYGWARLAFVGGSLVPVGGHNVLEPAAAGCPVCYGPHTGGIRHAVEVLERCDAGREVADAAALAGAVAEALRAPDVARARGARGRAALAAARGAAERSVALVTSELARRGAQT